jgi:hypothetical protein
MVLRGESRHAPRRAAADATGRIAGPPGGSIRLIASAIAAALSATVAAWTLARTPPVPAQCVG